MIILLFFLVFLFYPLQVYASPVAGSVVAGFDIPENSPEGIVRNVSVNVNSPSEEVYLYLNNDIYEPGYLNIGDELIISNAITGKSVTYNTECSTKKIPPINIKDVLDNSVFEQYGYQYVNFTFINKCTTAKDVDSLYFLYVFQEEDINKFINFIDLANRVLIDFKQTDGRWGNDRLQNSPDCGTLYGFGCAVTSVANVFTSYGKILFDDATSINPGSLNNWLSQNNGFIACNIVWATASRAIHIGPPLISFRNAQSDWQYGAQLIDTALSQGNLPIVGVSRPTGSHYFVVSEKLPDTNGKPDYKIVDPALYPFVENIPGNTGKALSEVYGGFDKVFQTVIYNKETTPQKALTARAHSPVQLLITDPNGIQTGYDTSDQQIKEDIPESVYGVEPGIAPVIDESPAGDETKYFQQINPADGDYTIQVIGTGNGSYTLDFTLDDEEGNSKVYVIKGYAQKGITETYIIHNIPGSDQPFTISKEVTYEVLIADLKKLYNQKQIKNKAFYQMLLAQVVLAEKTSLLRNQLIGNKLAILTLKAMQYEILKAKESYITVDAKTILMLDIQTLLTILTQNDGGGSGGGS